MPTEGTDVKSQWPMAQVTYRGVKYDTNDNKQTSTSKQDLVYRGVKLAKRLLQRLNQNLHCGFMNLGKIFPRFFLYKSVINT